MILYPHLNLASLEDCETLYELNGVEIQPFGYRSIFGYLYKYGTAYECGEILTLSENCHNGEWFRRCIDAAEKIRNDYGFPFYAGVVSLQGHYLMPHCWNVYDGDIYDLTFQHEVFNGMTRKYIGVELAQPKSIFELLYGPIRGEEENKIWYELVRGKTIC